MTTTPPPTAAAAADHKITLRLSRLLKRPVAGHSGLMLPSLLDLVPAEALKNVYATYYRNFTWTDTEQPGARQVEFAKKLAQYPDRKSTRLNSSHITRSRMPSSA